MEQGAKKLVKSKSGLRMVSVDLDINNPLYISEPTWTPDKECKHCMECSAKFDFMNRRHHCRRCGRCLCDTCCAQKLPLPRMRFVDPERQCGTCAVVTKEENDFFLRHLKVLTTGAIVAFSDTEVVDLSDGEQLQVFCRLAADHSRLEFTSSTPARCPESVGLSEILGFRLQPSRAASRDIEGNVVVNTVVLAYRNSCNEHRSATLAILSTQDNRMKTSQGFVFALSRALRLIGDSLQDSDRSHTFEEAKE